jgi:hypothetical protein
MLPEDSSRVLSASVVPVVIISACGLLCLAIYSRLASIVSRLRAFQRERLAEQEEYARRLFAGETDRVMLVRHHRVLAMLEEQTRGVIRRARLIRRTLICLLGTIACLTLCSLATGMTLRWMAAVYAAAILFFAGMGLLLIGILHALLEIKDSLHPVELESEFVTRLSLDFEQLGHASESNT